jgi:hypothetical protein
VGETGDGDELIPRTPGGDPLTNGRRLTFREARSWVKRSDALFGRWRGSTIAWVPDRERTAFIAEARQTEGLDCNREGDVVLYRLADRRVVVVVEEPYQG